jgi:hypothetical protein
MSEIEDHGTPRVLWPFVAVWRLLTMILALTGRIICAVLGLVFMAVGVTISLSIVGAPLGVPLAAFGLLLLVRSLF